MYSRYDAMAESKIKDTEDQVAYPDPLSINFNKVQLTSLPRLREVSEADLTKFWLFMLKQYIDIAEGDDILLTINNVPYLGLLKTGDGLFLPIAEDLYNVKSLANVI